MSGRKSSNMKSVDGGRGYLTNMLSHLHNFVLCMKWEVVQCNIEKGGDRNNWNVWHYIIQFDTTMLPKYQKTNANVMV